MLRNMPCSVISDRSCLQTWQPCMNAAYCGHSEQRRHPLQQALVQENCRRTEHELALKTEECKRLQEQQKTFAALMGALEAEHRKMNTSLMEGRKLVKGNRLVVSKQTSWLQSLVVKEELLLGAPGFSTLFTLASINLCPERSGGSPSTSIRLTI